MILGTMKATLALFLALALLAVLAVFAPLSLILQPDRWSERRFHADRYLS